MKTPPAGCRLTATKFRAFAVEFNKREGKMAETTPVTGTTPPRPTPPDSWRYLREEMDRLFDRVATGFSAPLRAFDLPTAFRAGPWFGTPIPAVDITEDEGSYRIIAEIPGLGPDDVAVTVSGNLLTIRGEKQEAREQKENGYHLNERRFGSFERSFTLPEGVDRDRIGAEFAKGVLTLTLPKSADGRAEQRKIEVKAAP
ncbi:Hsp20/alpha crystallin family protein [Rhodovastum atsumiense]|uniref:Hsp20/alpha crystallin family protein n=2 Tax=Rhodovastum atsumiense TaxID=504468 RepID=A0A5M6IX34_9PROT|nr:Hsp20/alpha crystallin family protein [Rhodovastum atsumiense]